MEIKYLGKVKIVLLLCIVFISLHFDSVQAISHVEIYREIKEIIIKEKKETKEQVKTFKLIAPYLHWLYKYCWHLPYDQAKPHIQSSAIPMIMLLDANQTYEEITSYIHSFFQGLHLEDLHLVEDLHLGKLEYLRELAETTSGRMFEYIKNYQLRCQNIQNDEMILFNAYSDRIRKGILKNLILRFQNESGVVEVIKNLDLSNNESIYSLILIFYGLNGLMVKNDLKDDFEKIREKVIREVFPALVTNAKNSKRELSNLLHFTVFMSDLGSFSKRKTLHVSDYKNLERELAKFESYFELLPHWRNIPIIPFTTPLAQVEPVMRTLSSAYYLDSVTSSGELEESVAQQVKAEKEINAEPDSVSEEKQPPVVLSGTKQHPPRAKSKKREFKRKRKQLAKQQAVTEQNEKANEVESIRQQAQGFTGDGEVTAGAEVIKPDKEEKNAHTESPKLPEEKHETREEEKATKDPLAAKPDRYQKKMNHPVAIQQPKAPKKKKKKQKQKQKQKQKTEESAKLDSNATPADQPPDQEKSVPIHKKKEYQANPELLKKLKTDFHTHLISLVGFTIQNPHGLQVSGYNAMQLQKKKLYGEEPILSCAWEFIVHENTDTLKAVVHLLNDAQKALDTPDYWSQGILEIRLTKISLLVGLKPLNSPISYRIDVQYVNQIEEGDTIELDEITFKVSPLKVLLLQSLVNSNVCDKQKSDLIDQWRKLECQHHKMGELHDLFEWSFNKKYYKVGEWRELDIFIECYLPSIYQSDDFYIADPSVLPKHLICSTCRQPKYGATVTPCKKVFCKGCINNSWPRNRYGKLMCPVDGCNDSHAPNTFLRDNDTLQELKAFQAREVRFDFDVKKLLDKNLAIKFLGRQIGLSDLPMHIHSLPVDYNEIISEETGSQKKETATENTIQKGLIETGIRDTIKLYKELIRAKSQYYRARDLDKKFKGRDEVKTDLIAIMNFKTITSIIVQIIHDGSKFIQDSAPFEEYLSREDLFSILLAMESSLAVYIELSPDIKRYKKKHDIQTLSNSESEKYFSTLTIIYDVLLKKDQQSDKRYHGGRLLLLHSDFRNSAFSLFNIDNLSAIFSGVTYLQILDNFMKHFSLASSSASPTDYFLFWNAYLKLFKGVLPQLKSECISDTESCHHLMAATRSQMNEWLERLAHGEFAHDSISDELLSIIDAKLNEVLRLNLSLLDRGELKSSAKLKASLDLFPSEEELQSEEKKSRDASIKAFHNAASMIEDIDRKSKEVHKAFHSLDRMRRSLLKRKSERYIEEVTIDTKSDIKELHETLLPFSKNFHQLASITAWFKEFELVYFKRKALQSSHASISDVTEKAVLLMKLVKKSNDILQELTSKHRSYIDKLYIDDSELKNYHGFLFFHFLFDVNRYLNNQLEEVRKGITISMIIISDLLQLQTYPHYCYKKHIQQLDHYVQEIKSESRRLFEIIGNTRRLGIDLQQGLALLQEQASALPLPAPWKLYSVNPGNCLYEALLMGSDQQHQPPSIDQIKTLRIKLHELLKEIIAYIKLRRPDEAEKLWSELAALTGMDQESLETVINSNYLLTPVLPDTSIADAWALEGEVSLVIPLSIIHFHSSIAVFSHPDQNNVGFLEPEVMGIVSTWVNTAPTLLNQLIENSIVDISDFPQSQSIALAISGNEDLYSSLVDSPPSFGVVHSGAASGSSFTGSSHFNMAAVESEQLTEIPSVNNQTQGVINQPDMSINNAIFLTPLH